MSTGVIPFAERSSSGEPDTSPTSNEPESREAHDAFPKGHGPLLEEPDEKKVCTLIEEELRRRSRARTRDAAAWERNGAWREGKRGVRVVDDAERGLAYVRYSFGSRSAPPSPNKTDQLIRKSISTLIVDPPAGDVEPITDDDDDRDAAELAERILKSDAPDIRRSLETALDLGGHCASAFVYTCVDPQGSGWEPLQVLAHPQAPHVDVALDVPEGAQPADYVLRYVREDGSLSDTAAGARLRWLPGLRDEVLTGHHVVLLPETASGIHDAHGVVILQYTTLGQLKAKFPRVAEMTPEDLSALVKWRPPDVKASDLVPAGVDVPAPDRATRADPEAGPDDATLVCAPTVYYIAHGTYPRGAYVVVAGGRFVLHRDTWCPAVGEGADAREEPLDLPLAQYRWLSDPVRRSPFGVAPAEKFGPGDEIRHSQLAAAIEFLYRFNNPITYLPMGSVVQPGALERARRTGDPVIINPGGQPYFEQRPAFPREAMEIYDRMGAELDSESGLEQAAQGVASPSVQSGRHAQQIVEQALVALSSLRDNTADGFTRQCRIRLQLMRAFFTTPQIVRFRGEDGAYAQREWTGTDLRGAKDVRITRGTFTLLSKSAKQALAREELEIGLKAGDPNAYATYRRAMSGNIDPLLGIEDDRHAERVRRQITAWTRGPDEGSEQAVAEWQQESQVMATQLQQRAQVAQAIGIDPTGLDAGMQPPPHPLTAAAAAIWAPLPVDDEPSVAWIRHQELARTMASTKYSALPSEWRAPFDAEYLRMRQAAGIQGVAEQQAAAQMQAQTEAATSAEGAARDGERADADRAAETERQQLREQAATERTQIQAAARSAPGAISS